MSRFSGNLRTGGVRRVYRSLDPWAVLAAACCPAQVDSLSSCQVVKLFPLLSSLLPPALSARFVRADGADNDSADNDDDDEEDDYGDGDDDDGPAHLTPFRRPSFSLGRCPFVTSPAVQQAQYSTSYQYQQRSAHILLRGSVRTFEGRKRAACGARQEPPSYFVWFFVRPETLDRSLRPITLPLSRPGAGWTTLSPPPLFSSPAHASAVSAPMTNPCGGSIHSFDTNPVPQGIMGLACYWPTPAQIVVQLHAYSLLRAFCVSPSYPPYQPPPAAARPWLPRYVGFHLLARHLARL